jgi:hypothetical protein
MRLGGSQKPYGCFGEQQDLSLLPGTPTLQLSSLSPDQNTNPGLLNLSCGAPHFSKIWPACGQNEIQYRGRRMNEYLTYLRLIRIVIHNLQQKYLLLRIGKFSKQNAIHNLC